MSRLFLLSLPALCLLLVSSTLQASDQSAAQWGNSHVVQLMPEEKLEAIRRSLPQVSDSYIQELLQSPDIIFYTEEEMPRAYQDWSGSLQGLHWAHYNISANGSEPYGNGNLEFPWGTPAGTHRAQNVSTFRFFRLPRNAAGRVLPIVWYRKWYPGDSQPGYAWVFPKGTIFGEVLQMKGPDGFDYTFELRTRERIADTWIVDAFRPFPTSDALAERIRQLRPNWKEQPSLAKLVAHLESPMILTRHTLADQHPLQVTFQSSMGLDLLPPVDDDRLVAQLLTETTFQSALGTDWRVGRNGIAASAPTTTAPFHVVPANYDAGFIEVDRVSCMRCHETVGQHVNRFDMFRDWYGRVRGSDGIFSFHPFAADSISMNGDGVPIRMRDEFVRAGILQRYDRKLHADRDYQRIPSLEN